MKPHHPASIITRLTDAQKHALLTGEGDPGTWVGLWRMGLLAGAADDHTLSANGEEAKRLLG
jgi:hypothetical protein